jgi:hypothetical protein
VPLDSAQATSMTIVFNEIVGEYPNDTWQIANYRRHAPAPAFLAAINPFEKVIDVRLRATGGGYFDVYLETAQTNNPLNSAEYVGHIRKG